MGHLPNFALKKKTVKNNKLCQKKMISIKSIFKSILTGVKKGYQTPTLPIHIIEFTNQPLTRILRVIGGVSFITMMSNRHLHFPL